MTYSEIYDEPDKYAYINRLNLKYYYINILRCCLGCEKGGLVAEHSIKALGKTPEDVTWSFYNMNKDMFAMVKIQPAFYIREVPLRFISKFNLNDQHDYLEFMDDVSEERTFWKETMK